MNLQAKSFQKFYCFNKYLVLWIHDFSIFHSSDLFVVCMYSFISLCKEFLGFFSSILAVLLQLMVASLPIFRIYLSSPARPMLFTMEETAEVGFGI